MEEIQEKKLNIIVELSSGLEICFDNKKQLKIEFPDSQTINMKMLI